MLKKLYILKLSNSSPMVTRDLLEVDNNNQLYPLDCYQDVPDSNGKYLHDVQKLASKAEQELQTTYVQAMETLMDAQAKTKGYDTRYTASARAGVTGSPFQVEGQAFALWMDSCYAMGYQILADVKAGTRTLPTVNAFLAELPVLVW